MSLSVDSILTNPTLVLPSSMVLCPSSQISHIDTFFILLPTNHASLLFSHNPQITTPLPQPSISDHINQRHQWWQHRDLWQAAKLHYSPRTSDCEPGGGNASNRFSRCSSSSLFNLLLLHFPIVDIFLLMLLWFGLRSTPLIRIVDRLQSTLIFS